MLDYSSINTDDMNMTWIYAMFYAWNEAYGPYHEYVSVIICLVGVICNAITIFIFTRPIMRSPINIILCTIAVCDTIVLVSNLANPHQPSCDPEKNTWLAAALVVLTAQTAMIFHSSSVWLSVCLAVLRLVVLQFSVTMSTQRSMRLSIQMIIATLVIVAAFDTPNALIYTIHSKPVHEWLEMASHNGCPNNRSNTSIQPGAVAYMVSLSDRAHWNDQLLLSMTFWIAGIAFKAVPCLLLCVLVANLLRVLHKAEERHQRLNKEKAPSSAFHAKIIARRKHSSRTTRMLLAVCLLCLFTEGPVGILTCMSGIFTGAFRQHIYYNLGDALDIISLINSLVTFVIYCSMSSQYRSMFIQIICPRVIRLKLMSNDAAQARRRRDSGQQRRMLGAGTDEMTGTDMSYTCSELHNINNILNHTAVKHNAPLIAVCANVAGVQTEYKSVMVNNRNALRANASVRNLKTIEEETSNQKDSQNKTDSSQKEITCTNNSSQTKEVTKM